MIYIDRTHLILCTFYLHPISVLPFRTLICTLGSTSGSCITSEHVSFMFLLLQRSLPLPFKTGAFWSAEANYCLYCTVWLFGSYYPLLSAVVSWGAHSPFAAQPCWFCSPDADFVRFLWVSATIFFFLTTYSMSPSSESLSVTPVIIISN